MRKITFAAGMAVFGFPLLALAQTPAPAPVPPVPTPQTASPTPPAFNPGPGGGGAAAAASAALPWMDAALDPDKRADMVIAAMTQDEKIALVHGYGTATNASNGGAGYVPGNARLGLPDLNLADSSVGLTRNGARGRYSTLLPSTIGDAASWDPQTAYAYGALIGREMRAEGYNVSLAGGIDITREPRNGRNFEYLGEDPVLAGESYAQYIRGLQDQKVIGDIKHYAFNDQETGRNIGNAILDEKSMRESDLLAFEIGVKKGQPGMVMCSYNKVNGDWSCENNYLLNQVLKQDWGFKGFVLSDWGGTHSTVKAALAGLDQEQPGGNFFGDALKQAIASGTVPQARLDDMVHRILRTEFASGIIDKRITPEAPDVLSGLVVARQIALASSVLLKNDGTLPLKAGSVKSILVIGSHADVGIITGGGSAQVDPPGGNAVSNDIGAVNLGQAGVFARGPVWWNDSPMKAIQTHVPGVSVTFVSGNDAAQAAAAARTADVVILFANQPASEGRDLANLSLPANQDALIDAVASANPHTVVVLETGGAVTMPWLSKVAAVSEIWFPGAQGAEAIADLLFGDVNFTGKLPVSFPMSEADLPVPVIAGSNITPVPVANANPPGLTPVVQLATPVQPNGPTLGVGAPVPPAAPARQRTALPPFDVPYPEKDAVGYKWYDTTGKVPLFPFGFGLSYTAYAYSDLKATDASVSFTVRNSGARDGAEIAEIYAHRPGDAANEKRLVGFTKVVLKAGESKPVTVAIDPLYLSAFDVKKHRWVLQAGSYAVMVGGSSRETPLTASFRVATAK